MNRDFPRHYYFGQFSLINLKGENSPYLDRQHLHPYFQKQARCQLSFPLQREDYQPFFEEMDKRWEKVTGDWDQKRPFESQLNLFEQVSEVFHPDLPLLGLVTWPDDSWGIGGRPGQLFLIRFFHLPASHKLPFVQPEHQCYRLHGHDFRIGVIFPLTPAQEFPDLKGFENKLASLKNRLLNQVPELANPTSENLAVYLYKFLQTEGLNPVQVEVMETPNSGCVFKGALWECYKSFNLEMAVPYSGDFSGFGLKVKLGVRGTLDDRMGWVLDFSQIKQRFETAGKLLDHYDTSSISGLSRSDSLVEICKFIHSHFSQIGDSLPLSSLELSFGEGRGLVWEPPQYRIKSRSNLD